MDKFNIINPAESPDVEKFSEKECVVSPRSHFILVRTRVSTTQKPEYVHVSRL